jgi:hypothetical protein
MNNPRKNELDIVVISSETDTVSQKDTRPIAEAIGVHARPMTMDSKVLLLHVNQHKKCDAGAGEHHFVLVTEPSVIIPENGKRWAGHTYVGPLSEDFQPKFSFPWLNSPDPRVDFELSTWSERQSRIVVLSANKFSCIRGELYSLRRASILSNDRVRLFGENWNQGLLRSAKTLVLEYARALCSHAQIGAPNLNSFLAMSRLRSVKPADDKFATMSDYKYSLVIENSLELRTEKLYDAIEAGTIPIYVGPKVEDGIPTSLFHHAEPRLDSIRDALENIAEFVEFEQWREQRREWLGSRSYLAGSDERLGALVQLLRSKI